MLSEEALVLTQARKRLGSAFVPWLPSLVYNVQRPAEPEAGAPEVGGHSEGLEEEPADPRSG